VGQSDCATWLHTGVVPHSECHEKVEYIHLDPVRGGLVKKPEDWKWSSMGNTRGVGWEGQERGCGLRTDRVVLPFNVHSRIRSVTAGLFLVCGSSARDNEQLWTLNRRFALLALSNNERASK
jgi:hypothetical protein